MHPLVPKEVIILHYDVINLLTAASVLYCPLISPQNYKATDKATSFGFSALLLLLSILEAPFSPPDAPIT